MSTTSSNSLFPSKDAIFKMHKFLHLYEQEIAQNVGLYDFNSQILEEFRISNDITLQAVTKSKYVHDLPKSNYIVFLKGNPTKQNDVVHDLLRHIRNAIGHALINKTAKNKAIFDLTDRTKAGAITMRGNISEHLFFSLINILQDSKR